MRDRNPLVTVVLLFAAQLLVVAGAMLALAQARGCH